MPPLPEVRVSGSAGREDNGVMYAIDDQSTTTSWRFALLGELRVAHVDRRKPLPPPRTHALLAGLLLRPGMHRREQLVALLFPDTPERTGRRRLSDRLWLLRDALPGLPVESDGDWLGIPSERRWLDVEAFRRKAAGAGLTDWQEALALYGGDLLPACADHWLLIEREALHLTYVELLHRAGDRLFRLGQFRETLPLAQRLMREEPLDERALRLLMRSYAALGRRGAALAAYERFVELAAEEADIAPTPATEALAQAIHTSGPPARPASALPDDAPADALVSQAREALDRGDRALARDCLEALRRQAPDDALAVRLLEADLALLCEEYERAECILCACGRDRAAVMARQAGLALTRRDGAAALEAASQALLVADEDGDRESSLEALLALARAQRRLGQVAQAMASAEQALNRARSLSSPAGVIRALLVQGATVFRQGRYKECLPIFHQAQSLAHEHGLPRYLGEALLDLAQARQNLGCFLDALADVQEALSIWRDLRLRRPEAKALQTLASIYDLLGRHGEALRAVERALEIYQTLGDQFGVAKCQYHLAAGLPYRDEARLEEAIPLAEEAAATFRAHGEAGWEASTLATLGFLLLLDEQYEAALGPLREAYAKHDMLGEAGYLPDPLAYQGLAHLGLGDLDEALDCTQRAVLAVAHGALESDVASEIYYAHALVLDSHGLREQAHKYLVRAYENLLRYAEQLEDEAARRAFFARGPMVRRLMKELYARGIARPPESGIVTNWLPQRSGRSESGDGVVPVTWTLDAGPADVALKRSKDAIALRRSRLARMLHEAKSQGGRPTIRHLANALGVSTRTIKRDLAAVRDAGRNS
ncbi:MAG: BTAD domain-containing putative transcriptional regulator [Chloroflexota bacterium]